MAISLICRNWLSWIAVSADRQRAGTGWRVETPGRPARPGRRRDRTRDEALQRVGLSGFGQRTIATLSGGQLQRARFARLLVQDTPIILLDEPFNNVDTRTRDTLLTILAHWRAQQRTVAVVVHDMGLAHEHFFPETLLLAHEVIAWGDTASTLSEDNLQRAQQMTEYWQNDAPWCARP